jgi:hypothetical protein
MTPVTLAFIVTMIELVAKYGVPTALSIIQAFKVENPTLDDIEALRNRVPPPETYLPGGA